MPLGVAFMNLLIPLMIGARDVAFPRLNAFSYWVFLLGGLFLVAGVAKLVRFGEFRRSLDGYRLARPRRLVAPAVPALELLIGLGLVAGAPAAGWASRW